MCAAVSREGPEGPHPMNLLHLNPKELPDWSHTFSQVVVVEHDGLRHVHVSGQVGVDALKRLVGDGSFETQIEGAFSNLELALASAGASWPDVVKLTIYVIDYPHAPAQSISRAISSRFEAGRFPALSLVGVAALADPAFLVEVEAIAVARAAAPAP
jgi:enamine deaminase RidA (YjgF/YER057c/UK114 family)